MSDKINMIADFLERNIDSFKNTCNEYCYSESDATKIIKVLREKNHITIKELKENAFEFSVDYKPWVNNLPPQRYFESGFLKGQEYILKTLGIEIKK